MTPLFPEAPMLDVLKELTRQLPSAVAIIVVVVVFIRYLTLSEQRRETSEQLREERAERAEALRLAATREIGESCHTFQREMAQRHELHHERMSSAIDRNTEAMARNTVALERSERADRSQAHSQKTPASPQHRSD